jgi:hypothetical protein
MDRTRQSFRIIWLRKQAVFLYVLLADYKTYHSSSLSLVCFHFPLILAFLFDQVDNFNKKILWIMYLYSRKQDCIKTNLLHSYTLENKLANFA